MRYLIIALLLAGMASAYTISDYPHFFVKDDTFDAIYVVGEESPALDVVSATMISTALARYNVTTEVGTSYVDSDIANITRKNAIVVGSPCENRAAAVLEGDPRPCYDGLGGSVGYIKLFEQNGRVQVLITGLTEEDRHAAAKYFAQKELSNIEKTTYMVPSKSGSTPPFFVQKDAKNKTVNKTPEKAPVVEQEEEPVPSIPEETAEPEQKKEPAEYEPLDEIPEKEEKGFFAAIWAWIAGLFT